VEIPDQNTDSLARRIHLFSPYCLRWIAWTTWFLMKAGITILLPFSTRPSSNVRSHRKFQNPQSSYGHCFPDGGQPLKMVFLSRLMVWSCAVEDFTAVSSMGLDMKWMLHCDAESSFTCSGSCPPFLWHTRDKASATGMDLPCLFWTWTSNHRHLRSSLCNSLGASLMFFCFLFVFCF